MPWGLLSSGSLIGAGISDPKMILWHDWWTQASPKRFCIDSSCVFVTLQLIVSVITQPRAIKGETGVLYDLALEERFCQPAVLYLSHRRKLVRFNSDREECESRSLG